MGSHNSKPFYPPPTSFSQCFVDGELCIYRYYLYRRRQDEIDNMVKFNLEVITQIKKRKLADLQISDNSKSSYKKTRTVKNIIYMLGTMMGLFVYLLLLIRFGICSM